MASEVAKSLSTVRKHASKAKTTAAQNARSTEAFAARATRDQAIRAAQQKGASAGQIAAAAGLSPSRVREIVREGPFGRKRSWRASRSRGS
jgi:hypothetical protein